LDRAPAAHSAFTLGAWVTGGQNHYKQVLRTKKPRNLQGFSKRLMGLEPTTFCMAIV